MTTKRSCRSAWVRRTVIGAAAAVAVAATSGIATAEDMELKLAGVVPVEHYGNKVLENIAADIEAANVGLKVKLYPAGQLGSGEELLGDAARGNVDLVHAFVYSHKDPVLEINSLPYLVSNHEEMQRVYGNKNSAFYRIFSNRLDRLGVKMLGMVAEGFVGVVTTKKPDDYAIIAPKGLNIRVWSAQTAKWTTEEFGYRTTTMNWGDVFAAIQQGAVDGAHCCTPQLTYTQFALSGVGKYFIPYQAFVEASTYYASKKTWEKLNDEQRAAIEAAFDKGAADFNAWAKSNDATYLQKLEEKGIEVLELTDEQRQALADHIRETVWPKVADRIGQDILDQLREDL
jgi:TRAP-type C4-dicarboxylate transport system substrate-binding protein